MGPDEGFGDAWNIHANVVPIGVWKCHLDTWLCTWIILVSVMRFGGGHVGPDEGFRDVWDIYAGDVHDSGLEMSL